MSAGYTIVNNIGRGLLRHWQTVSARLTLCVIVLSKVSINGTTSEHFS